VLRLAQMGAKVVIADVSDERSKEQVLWIERFETLESTSDTTRSAAGGAREAVTNGLLDGKEGVSGSSPEEGFR
jgi:hypothetical protein